MQERIYKASFSKFIFQIFYLICGCAFLWFILSFFLEMKISIAISVSLFLIVLFFTIRDKKTFVKITDDTISIVSEKKIYEYKLNEVSIRTKSRNNSTFDLYITDLNGNTKSFDLSFLDSGSFYKLIEDIGIVGDKAESISLSAK